MFIVQIASELSPVAKVGGLAEVVFGLSRELEIRGNSVEIILPKYDCMNHDEIYGLQMDFQGLDVPWGGGVIHCSVWFGFVHGRKVFFIEPHGHERFFQRGGYYGYSDEAERFALFSKAALEFLLHTGKRPDILHVHDWQTALVPVFLWEMYQHAGMETLRVCLTIHNFKHQGVCGPDLLWQSGLGAPEHYMDGARLGDDVHHGALNILKGGIVYSNFITTVSPTHAWEARHTDQGFGLGHALHFHQDKFGGILNGLDYEVWNPAIDRYIPAHYDSESMDGKYADKAALRDRLMLRDDYSPVIAYVGRLDSQKGVHLIRHALHWSLGNGAQFVLLGKSPEGHINDQFLHLKDMLNDDPDCHVEIGFDEGLAHLIYAGADIMIVPSMFEPCGLAQMAAMTYGTVPVVRAVGGLNDTVIDRDHADVPMPERTGYVFHGPDEAGIDSALSRAVGLWYDYPDAFRALMQAGMARDFSWNHPGQHYINVFEYIRHK